MARDLNRSVTRNLTGDEARNPTRSVTGGVTRNLNRDVRRGAVRRAVTAVAMGVTLCAASCASAEEPAARPAEPLEEAWSIDGAMDPELADEVEAIAKRFDGEAAIALAVPGATSKDGPVSAGEVSDVAAWSTSKVPVAIASSRDNEWVADLVPTMISESDNDAAETLWVAMGGPNDAAAAVNEVLAEGGDVTTEFDAMVAPGDTRWELEDQAAFAANLSCIDGAEPVLEAMGEIVDYQSYGLGQIDGARFKGGWGPDDEGGYLSRQLGMIPVEGGVVGVAIAARPEDATDETGREMLDALAEAIADHAPRGGECETAPVKEAEESAEEAASEESTSEETTSESTPAGRPTSETLAPEESAPGKRSNGDPAPEESVPGRSTSGRPTSERPTSGVSGKVGAAS